MAKLLELVLHAAGKWNSEV